MCTYIYIRYIYIYIYVLICNERRSQRTALYSFSFNQLSIILTSENLALTHFHAQMCTSVLQKPGMQQILKSQPALQFIIQKDYGADFSVRVSARCRSRACAWVWGR